MLDNRMESGKIYFPVAKTLLTNGHIESIIMFEATEEKFIPIRAREVKNGIKNGYDIRGFSGNTLLPTTYYRYIRNAESEGDGKPQWLVYRKDIIKRKAKFRLVSEDNQRLYLTREELIAFLNDGNVVLGTMKVEPSQKNPSGWRISGNLIISVNNDEPCLSNGRLKTLPGPEEIREKIRKETGEIIE